ncbi:hypothetical protein IHE44_0009329 [Lamprotornis superbus]|uniref:Uncharacterized protein n=1 Tax=Lamprotornis superbus TaxID=245042 RepID=A0A835P619_9PASS|nr:hypothetical protein IHE44_0009329 [Lamprotornis superbus]
MFHGISLISSGKLHLLGLHGPWHHGVASASWAPRHPSQISDTFREHTMPPALLHVVQVPALVLGWFALTWCASQDCSFPPVFSTIALIQQRFEQAMVTFSQEAAFTKSSCRAFSMVKSTLLLVPSANLQLMPAPNFAPPSHSSAVAATSLCLEPCLNIAFQAEKDMVRKGEVKKRVMGLINLETGEQSAHEVASDKSQPAALTDADLNSCSTQGRIFHQHILFKTPWKDIANLHRPTPVPQPHLVAMSIFEIRKDNGLQGHLNAMRSPRAELSHITLLLRLLRGKVSLADNMQMKLQLADEGKPSYVSEQIYHFGPAGGSHIDRWLGVATQISGLSFVLSTWLINLDLLMGMQNIQPAHRCEGEYLTALALGVAALSALQLCWSELVPEASLACPVGTSTLCTSLSPRDLLMPCSRRQSLCHGKHLLSEILISSREAKELWLDSLLGQTKGLKETRVSRAPPIKLLMKVLSSCNTVSISKTVNAGNMESLIECQTEVSSPYIFLDPSWLLV